MKHFFFLILVALSLASRAQQSKSITEDTPLAVDGIEYGFAIKNVSTREVGNKDFSRYAVTFYATNKSQCSRIIFYNQSMSLLESDMKILAKFDCINATGARLTSKSGQVEAKPMWVNAKVNTRDEKGNPLTATQKVQIGYYLGVGETAEQEVILIVPLNSKPEVRVRVVNSAAAM